MKNLSCFHCGAEVTNGIALCETCQAGARVYLEFVPVYFRNLARWKPGRAGGRPVPGSRIPPGVQLETVARTGTGDRISDVLDEVLTTLSTWARALTDDRTFVRPLIHADAVLMDESDDDPATSVRLLCAGLDHHLGSIATLDWCGELVRDLGAHEKRLRDLTETYVPGWYAGGCRQINGADEDECGSGTYVVPGLTWVTCQACGTTTYARDHLETILVEARGWTARPTRLAEAIVALVDTEISVPRLNTRIRQWVHQGQLSGVYRTQRGYAYDVDEDRMVVAEEQVGYARYRLGEVLDLTLRKETRAVPAQAS